MQRLREWGREGGRWETEYFVLYQERLLRKLDGAFFISNYPFLCLQILCFFPPPSFYLHSNCSSDARDDLNPRYAQFIPIRRVIKLKNMQSAWCTKTNKEIENGKTDGLLLHK